MSKATEDAGRLDSPLSEELGPLPQPTTSEDVAFWACLVISQIWGAWSIGRGGGAVFAAVPWLVLAVALRWPYWKRLLNDKRA